MLYVPQINQFIFQTTGAMKNNMEVSFAFLMIFTFVLITLTIFFRCVIIKL